MNIYVQCCSLIIMIVLLISYFRQHKVGLSTEKAFLMVAVSSTVCIILDLITVAMIYYVDMIPEGIPQLVGRIYLVSVVFITHFGVIYVCVDIHRRSKYAYKMVMRQSMMLLISTILILFVLPVTLYSNGSVAYVYGWAAKATYFFAVHYLLVILVHAYRNKQNMNSVRYESVRIWALLWIAVAVFQYLIDSVMVVSFAIALGSLIMYIKLEDPSTNMDRESGLFNQNAYMEYIKELYSAEKDFSTLIFILDPTLVKLFKTTEGRAIARDGMAFLWQINEAKVFRRAEDELLIIFEDTNKAKEISEKIFTRVHQAWGPNKDVFVKSYFAFIEHSNVVKNTNEMYYLVKHVLMNRKDMLDSEIMYVGDDVIQSMYKEMKMEAVIIDALENDRIVVYYQPIYSTEDKSFTTAEALARIIDKNGNIVPPGEFIPVAESNGKILDIGDVVFEKVCKFIKENNITELGLKYIEVNLSMIQCADKNLAYKYLKIIEKYGINPEHINLEITESASITAKKILLENMKCLMDKGVHFSLDDFGTGQSNLNYIVDMPVAMVKFDRDMTNAYFDNKKAKHVMNAAMTMIKGMELKIVSEGIETEKQYKIMEDLGIGYIQGYYFSKPLPEKEFIEFVRKAN